MLFVNGNQRQIKWKQPKEGDLPKIVKTDGNQRKDPKVPRLLFPQKSGKEVHCKGVGILPGHIERQEDVRNSFRSLFVIEKQNRNQKDALDSRFFLVNEEWKTDQNDSLIVFGEGK